MRKLLLRLTVLSLAPVALVSSYGLAQGNPHTPPEVAKTEGPKFPTLGTSGSASPDDPEGAWKLCSRATEGSDFLVKLATASTDGQFDLETVGPDAKKPSNKRPLRESFTLCFAESTGPVAGVRAVFAVDEDGTQLLSSGPKRDVPFALPGRKDPLAGEKVLRTSYSKVPVTIADTPDSEKGRVPEKTVPDRKRTHTPKSRPFPVPDQVTEIGTFSGPVVANSIPGA